ncbi:MAG: hypothetical protein IID17_04275 [Nitrospinae bacterium]|nr:hypothetical protein [Nitrospinota bacterium]
MLHEVRVFSPKGKLKKLISCQELKKKHWKKFEEMSHDLTIGRFSRRRVPGYVKQNLDNVFLNHDDEC